MICRYKSTVALNKELQANIKEKDKLGKQLSQAQKMDSIGRLAGGVAHDLNNLLSPIIGYSDLLSDSRALSGTEKLQVEQINSAGHKASDLVKQLLAFSRKQVLEYKVVNLNEVISGFEELLRRTIREDISIHFLKSSDIQLINADIGQLEQVLMNLSVNASDAMQNGGILTIETARVNLDASYPCDALEMKAGDYVMLAISDNGQGMDKETRENIFEPFFTTKGELGTGLGLATVYGILKQHNANILVYSEIAQGTTFKIYFPVSEDQIETEKVRLSKVDVLDGTESILLVEDEESVREVVKQILETNGYSVISFGDGHEAIDFMNTHAEKIDLLITDVIMPKMNGKELYSILTENISDLKVIYISGYTDNVIVQHGILGESLQFLQKPFSVKDLLTKIRGILDS